MLFFCFDNHPTLRVIDGIGRWKKTGGQGDDVARLPLLKLDVRATFCYYATRCGYVCGSRLGCFAASSSCYYTDCFGYIELAAWSSGHFSASELKKGLHYLPLCRVSLCSNAHVYVYSIHSYPCISISKLRRNTFQSPHISPP